MDKSELKSIAESYGIDVGNNFNVIETGLDFQVIIQTNGNDGDWVLRFPRRREVFKKAEYEKKLLDELKNMKLGFETPFFEVFEENLIAYRKIKGTLVVIAEENMSYKWGFDLDNIPKAFTDSLAKSLVNLHNCDFKTHVIIHENLRLTMENKINRIKEHFAISDSLLEKWDKWLKDYSYWPKKTGLIHGDLYPGHILIDDEKRVVGIIDWTEAKVSDISYDFLAHFKLFGEKALEDLIQSYIASGGYHWEMMKEHIIILQSTEPLMIAEFALSSGLKDYHDLAAKLLKGNPEIKNNS